MSGFVYGIVTVEDYIDCGLRLQLGAARTLSLYREMGGKIRTKEFYSRWDSRKTQFQASPQARTALG